MIATDYAWVFILNIPTRYVSSPWIIRPDPESPSQAVIEKKKSLLLYLIFYRA